MPRILLRRTLEILIFCSVFLFPIGFQYPASYSTEELATPVTQTTTNPKPGTQSEPGPGDANSKPASTHALAVETTPVEPTPGTPASLELTPVAPTPAEPAQPIRRLDVQNKVGLSFDDGPNPKMTGQYLKVLQEHNVKATFFMVGQQVKYYPGEAQKVIQQGSEIGSHSWRHARLDKLQAKEIKADFHSVVEQVYATTKSTTSLFRPPYGRLNETVLAAAQQLNQQVILWDVDPRDWENPTPQQIVQRVLNQVKPGSIILLHEGYPNTLEALPMIITKLRERGLEPVPVSELLEQYEKSQLETAEPDHGHTNVQLDF